MELYIHIPFCVRKCRYCDFLSFASDACVREKYVDQLIREIESIPEEDAGQCSENAAPRLNLTGRTVETIFIGGGTPSVPDSALIVGIMEHVRKAFHVAEGAEISMEALCPEEQGAKRCMQAADALVTKLSGGVPGLTISRICAEECRFAADADCYSCKVTAHALAYVYALANEEETEFTDFILKGEVQ